MSAASEGGPAQKRPRLEAPECELKAAQEKLEKAIEMGKSTELVRVLEKAVEDARKAVEDVRKAVEDARQAKAKAEEKLEKAQQELKKAMEEDKPTNLVKMLESAVEDAKQMRNYLLNQFDQPAREALDPGESVGGITGGTSSKNPVYVHYTAGPADKRQQTGDPTSSSGNRWRMSAVVDVECPAGPKLEDVELNTLLDVVAFKQFLMTGTVADRKLLAHSTLKAVHAAVLKELKESPEKRLITIMGCPGTGKTWCGWLLAHSLVQDRVPTLNIGLREEFVARCVEDLKQVYTVEAENFFLLAAAVADQMTGFVRNHGTATRTVVIVDVGGYGSHEASIIFMSVRRVLKVNPDSGIRVVAISSGHGRQTMLGKCQETMNYASEFVFWSWTREQFECFQTVCKASEEAFPEDIAYDICGGSCRQYFSHKVDLVDIRFLVRDMSQIALQRLMNLDLPTSDADARQRSRLLAFRPIYDERPPTWDNVRVEPRSKYVIQSIRLNRYTEFNMLARMYSMLKLLNKGAAGVAFEQLVHNFWREAVENKSKVALTLKAAPDDEDAEELIVDCSAFIPQTLSIEKWAKKVGEDPPLGYFTPQSQGCPVVDAILRFQAGETTRVLAIQVSIALKHSHADFPENPLLPARPVPELALWSCREFPCRWSGKSESWLLKYVYCDGFEQKLRPALG